MTLEKRKHLYRCIKILLERLKIFLILPTRHTYSTVAKRTSLIRRRYEKRAKDTPHIRSHIRIRYKKYIVHRSRELWTIRTLANSALVNSAPKKFGPSQFGPRPLVNLDPDHWSIRTLFYWSIRTSKRKILWSIRTFSIGQFGPFPLVNSDPVLLSIRTFSIGQFGPLPHVFSIKKTAFRLNTSRPNTLNEISIHIQAVQFAVLYDGLAFHW